jgi:hypothetical protein
MKPLRYVLRTGSAVFGGSAVALIVAPSLFLELLGLEPTLGVMWSMVMIGVTVAALAGNLAVVSWRADDTGVRIASVVMAFSAAGLGLVTLLIPVTYTWFTLAYAGIGFAFSLAYILGLLATRRAR